MARWRWVMLILTAVWTVTCDGYLAVLSSGTPVGTVVFEAGVPQLGGRRRYEASSERTAWFARKLLKVHPHMGRVTLAKTLSCDGLQYPRIFTFYVDSTSSRLGRPTIDYYSLPLRILITGCGGENHDLAATRGWMAETLASYAMPSTDRLAASASKISDSIFESPG